MKLLFDHNLSPRLVANLADLYPDSQHVFPLGMGETKDSDIWDYAIQHDFIIVTRDSNYTDLRLLKGFPPKVIWIRQGNGATQTTEQLLRAADIAIQSFNLDKFADSYTLSACHTLIPAKM